MYKPSLCISRPLFSRPENWVLGNTLCIRRPPFLKFNEVRTQEINDFFYVCIKSWTWNFKNFPTQKQSNVNSCALVNFKSRKKTSCKARAMQKCREKGQSEQPILTPYCLCSLNREVNKLKSRMFQRNVHIVSELSTARAIFTNNHVKNWKEYTMMLHLSWKLLILQKEWIILLLLESSV